MAIIIIDNFQVDISNPIDNRFVVGSQSIPSGPSHAYPTPFYAYRDDIVYKYPGLRIWDFNDNVPYFWNGTAWINENTTGALIQNAASGNTGFENYIVKFQNNTTLLTKSNIYDTLSNIGIGLTGSDIQPGIPIASPGTGLHVKGNIRSGGWLIGNINADYIVDGLLNLERITPPGTLPSSGVYILKNTTGYVSGTSWDLAENIINTTSIVDDTTSPTNHYLTFVETIGHKQMKISTSKLQFNPNSGQLFLDNGTKNNPAYSFINSTETGIYYDYNINFSKQGNNFVSIVDNGISIKSTDWPQISFINTTTNSNKLLWVAGDDLLYRLDANYFSTDKRVWHQDNLFTLKTLGDKNVETGRNLNISITNAGTNDLITGVYTYNVYSTTISPSSNNFWSVLSFGKGDAGSIQLASNWNGNNSIPTGNVVADRDILIRSLNATDSWSPWVKVWNSGNSGYVPFGAIIMWSGTIAQIPTGWRLCDGNNGNTVPILAGSVPGQVSMTSITIPDLTERFIVGAGSNEDIVSYDFNTFVINATLPFFNGTSTVNKNINRVFVKVDESSLVNNNVIYRSALGSPSINPETDSKYAIYYAQGNTGAESYFLVYNINTKNYRLYNNFIQINGVTLSPGSYPYYDPQAGSLAELSQIGDLVTYRPNFTQLSWQVSNVGYSVGDKGGFTNVRLHTSQIPAHTHSRPKGNDSNTGTGYGWYPIDDQFGSYPTDFTGGDLPHENRPPYYALAFIIYTGI